MAPKRKLSSDSADLDNVITSKKSKNEALRVFKESWKNGNLWLKYDNETKLMFCNLCLQHKKTNSFTSGCPILKKDSVTKHAKSKDHSDCAAAKTLALGKVGVEGRRNELLNFVHLSRALGSDPTDHTVTDSLTCANLAILNRDSFPAAAEAAQRFLLLPVSTADCERGFSKQNLVKTSLRNCLSDSSLDNLLKIFIDGPSMSNFPYKKAFKLWAASKSRMILK